GEGRIDDLEVGRSAREIDADRVRHRREQVRARDHRRQAHEVRRREHDRALDPLALEELLEDLLAPAFGAHYRVAELEKARQGKRLTDVRMVVADEAREVVREKTLLEEALALEVGKVADREIDLSGLELRLERLRRQGDRADRCRRRQRAQPLEDLRE